MLKKTKYENKIYNIENKRMFQNQNINNKMGSINIGLDAGSTTLKVVVTDSEHRVIYKKYGRHYADIVGMLHNVLLDLMAQIGDIPARLCVPVRQEWVLRSVAGRICARSGGLVR